MTVMRSAWLYIAMSAAAVFLIWQPLVARSQGFLTVTFLDVGQGDAIFIESPSGRQVLVDGGRDRSVLRELGDVMAWHDRSIDMMIATHPDLDHINGLIDVLERFEVAHILVPGVESDSPVAAAFEAGADREGAERRFARRGDVIDLGDGVRIEILFPDRDVSGLETNTASIVARIVYGSTSVLLTGDSPSAIEKYLVSLDGAALASTVLKAGHHGSKTSSDAGFVEAVSPLYAVFSRGCGNTYGHPHAEVVAVMQEAGVQTLDTCEDGRIEFVSNGAQLSVALHP